VHSYYLVLYNLSILNYTELNNLHDNDLGVGVANHTTLTHDLFGSTIGRNNDGDDDDNEELSKPESNEDKDDEDEDIEDDDKDDALASEGYSQEGDDSEISNANNNVIDQDNEDSDQDGNGFSSPLKTLNRMKPSKNGSSVGHIATRANKKKEKNPTASTSNGPQKHLYGVVLVIILCVKD